MNHENQPKTINDYIDVVKILKLKIIKQNKKIQQLQLKNKTFQDQINGFTLRAQDMQISSRAMIQLQNDVSGRRQQKQIQINTLLGKVQVLNLYVKGIQRLGITPQAVFRIADVGYKGYVQSDYFRQVISKIKLGLTQKQISCLIFIFDQFCQGFISRQDYNNSLHAYKIGVQNNCHPFIQDSIFKLSQMLHVDKVILTKFYQEMEAKSKNNVKDKKIVIELATFQEQIKKYYGGKISEREIVASFNAIDLQAVGYLEKRNFLYSVIWARLKSVQEIACLMEQQFKSKKNTSPKKPEKFIDTHLDASRNLNNNYTPGYNSSIISKYESQYQLTIYKVYQQLLTDDFTKRLTLKTFKTHLLTLNNTLSSQVITKLYKEADNLGKGSLYFNQLINFYLSNSNDNEMILIGKYFNASDLDSEKFWFMFGLQPTAQISKNKFLQSMRKSFESKQDKLWQNMWSSFDKGRGSCNVGSIIKVFKKYELQ